MNEEGDFAMSMSPEIDGNRAEREDHKPKIEVKIPEHVVAHLKDKTAQIMGLFDDEMRRAHLTPDPIDEWYLREIPRPDAKPNVVLVALRGAGLYTPMLQRLFERQLPSDQRPVVVEAWIGRYGVVDAEIQKDNDILPPNANFFYGYDDGGKEIRQKQELALLDLEEDKQEIVASIGRFRGWVSARSEFQAIADRITEAAMVSVSEPVPMVIDDWQSDGHTMMVAAEVSHMAFGNDADPYCVALYGVEGRVKGLVREDEQIIASTFGNAHLPDGSPLLKVPKVTDVLKDMLRGYVEVRGEEVPPGLHVVDGGLVSTDNASGLAFYASRLNDQSKQAALQTLRETFGDEEVLAFRGKVAQKFADEVVG